MQARLLFAIILAPVFLIGCGDDGDGASGETPAEPLQTFFRPVPEAPPHPADNPHSAEKTELGELLFWDPILSGDMNVACASCHHPAHAWADGRPRSVGSDGHGLGPGRSGSEMTDFNSPSVLDAAFAGLGAAEDTADFISGPYFWDARAATLEEQALQPIQNPVEMLGYHYGPDQALALVESRLAAIPEYVDLFTAAFDDPDPVTAENLARALATFQRSLITPRTRFDAYLEGNLEALSAREILGLNKFVNGGCARCHSGVMLSDYVVHAGEPVLRGLPAVRTAPLRGVALTAPYMHNGSIPTLRDAIELYEDRGDLQVSLDDDDFGDIQAFLGTLTPGSFYRDIPVSVPSGLTVGGNIH